MSPRRLLAFNTAIVLALTSCGSQDYETPPSGQKPPATSPVPQAEPPPPPANESTTEKRLAPKGPPKEGYLWRGLRWVEVPDETLEQMKCAVADGSQVNYFQVIGTTLVAGAILGVVVRSSGSWFFGQPIEPGPGHWFWNRLDKTLTTGREGIARGAAFSGICSLLLTGASYWPVEGILGQNFSAVSSAIAVGSLGSIAAAQPMSSWLETQFQKFPTRINRNRGPIYNGSVVLNRWSRQSEFGKSIRYKIAPGIFIVGLGFGIGLLIYDHLQKGTPACEQPRAQAQPAAAQN